MFVKRTAQGSPDHCPFPNLPVSPSQPTTATAGRGRVTLETVLSASSMDFLTSSQTSLAPSSLASSIRNPGGWDGVNALKSAPLLFAKTCLCTAPSGQLAAWAPMKPWLGPGAAALRLGWPAQLLWVSALSSAVSPPAPPSPRTSSSLGRSVLGLDKCNACIGTSICKKFFKEEIRSESQSEPSEGEMLFLW